MSSNHQFSSPSRGGGSVYRHVHIVYPKKRGVIGGGGKLGSYVSASRLCRVGGGGLIRAFIAFVR